MGMRIFKNVYRKIIRVNSKELLEDGVIKIESITQEVKNLVECGYLKEVNQTKVKGTLK